MRAPNRPRPSRAATTLAMALLLLAASAVAAPPEPDRGRADYIRYCASCHGVKGDGAGPVAIALVKSPADLRQLFERYGSPLDRDRVGALIDGRAVIPTHGQREMPVWGQRFDALPPEDDARERTIAARLKDLIAYLQAIQRDR
jgi:mono/diheme cytochrome c family protein